ncbi:uncharacterized protein MELLADRAFT_67988 [Melampsora larici-populina 98AG31]|uniref:Uncharacterized protein n=1 Tax=Melampsora larici-populina (strain 98AG31 / pathotype 3-4-7) TaxID=747676 RepID=F4S567_MELLP|nr:uncharacterized protein MELLADRAFT_67988 [Melampsora larici-populina 98AG31]EGG00214.1 hypothetical protein MELLADRAFT_67988 [Melampsora larici-populina 98AG31]
MVLNPYIGAKYRRLPSFPTIPIPAHGTPVGLACPECPPSNTTSLIYPSSKDETKDTINVIVGLNIILSALDLRVDDQPLMSFPTTLNQLRHEIALINAGATYPIPFDASAHGPQVNVHGMPLAPRTGVAQTSEPSGSNNRLNRIAPAIDCARPHIGPTAKGHKKTGHTGCTHRFCKSCCVAFTPAGGCYVHRVKAPPPQPATNPSATATPARLAPPPNPPVAKRPKLLPAQCAQSVRRVGHMVNDKGLLVLARARLNVTPATPRVPNPAFSNDAVRNQGIDRSKVVSLHFVTRVSESHTVSFGITRFHSSQRCLQGSSNPVISQLFNDWPVAVFSNSPSLMRDTQAAAGQAWNGHLVVWDEEIRNWRELGLDIPHTYIETVKNLVICLPHERSSLSLELQEKLEGFQLGKPLVPQIKIESTDSNVPQTQISTGSVANANVQTGSIQNARFPNRVPPNATKGTRAEPICLLFDSDSDEETHQQSLQPWSEMPSTPACPSTPASSLLGNPAEEVDELDVKPSHSDLHPQEPEHYGSLKEWPGKELLVSSLLDWFISAGIPPRRKARIQLWHVRFGSKYRFSKKTVYHYAGWVKLVGYERMVQWAKDFTERGEHTMHNLTVAQTRPHFQSEYNAVCSLSGPPKEKTQLGIKDDATQTTPTAAGPAGQSSKRKRSTKAKDTLTAEERALDTSSDESD